MNYRFELGGVLAYMTFTYNCDEHLGKQHVISIQRDDCLKTLKNPPYRKYKKLFPYSRREQMEQTIYNIINKYDSSYVCVIIWDIILSGKHKKIFKKIFNI